MSGKVKKPRKWHEVVAGGTKEGDEEQAVFIALARHKKYEWRSIEAISAESGVAEDRVEQILQKYHARGMVVQSPKNETLWAYWERVPQLIAGQKTSLSADDKEERINKALSPSMVANPVMGGHAILMYQAPQQIHAPIGENFAPASEKLTFRGEFQHADKMNSSRCRYPADVVGQLLSTLEAERDKELVNNFMSCEWKVPAMSEMTYTISGPIEYVGSPIESNYVGSSVDFKINI